MRNNNKRKQQLFKKILDELINTTLILGDKQNMNTSSDVVDIYNKIDHKKKVLINMFESQIDINFELKYKNRYDDAKK